jgi:hypothetical protein
MPWLALPFGDPSGLELTKLFDVRDTPAVVHTAQVVAHSLGMGSGA